MVEIMMILQIQYRIVYVFQKLVAESDDFSIGDVVAST